MLSIHQLKKVKILVFSLALISAGFAAGMTWQRHLDVASDSIEYHTGRIRAHVAKLQRLVNRLRSEPWETL